MGQDTFGQNRSIQGDKDIIEHSPDTIPPFRSARGSTLDWIGPLFRSGRLDWEWLRVNACTMKIWLQPGADESPSVGSKRAAQKPACENAVKQISIFIIRFLAPGVNRFRACASFPEVR